MGAAMLLQLPPEWVFSSPGPLPDGAISDFYDLALKVAEQGERWPIIERFKAAFGEASHSSSESWAESDLLRVMCRQGEANAPAFIAAFCRALSRIQEGFPGHALPSEAVVNAILSKHDVPYEVRPPKLLPRHGHPPPPVVVAEESVDASARNLILSTLEQAERFLAEGKPRQAVQEVLWLLETVSTAFNGRPSGAGTVEGKYFNEIVRDLRRHNSGTFLSQASEWMTKLHGFLSSPSGGGVRHGAKLGSAADLKPHEAALICNLTRSYIGYLLAELAAHPQERK
jgi:hypothetical protein